MEFVRSMQKLEELFRNKYADRVFKALFRRFGMNVTVLRKKIISSASVFNPPTEAGDLSSAALNVFGDFSGVSPAKPYVIIDEDPTENVEFQARIVIAKFPNNAWDAASTGMLEQQIVFSSYDLQPQDLIVINSEDGTVKRGIVGDRYKYGNMDHVYGSWTYNNLGGTTT